ncbi:MAG: hypothetical protein ACOH2J_10580 [Allorhizobium sp.]
MNLQLPDPKSFGGAVLNGWTVASAGGAESRSGVIVVKAAYKLATMGGPHKILVRSTEANRFAIVYQDIGDPIEDGYTLRREADIALQKARVDIVVKGWGGANVQGEVRVDGEQWLFRAAASVGPADLGLNLFGWHSRSETPRQPDTDEHFTPQPNDQLPPEYGPEFNNFYRRSPGFTATADLPAMLPSGKVVAIRRTVGGKKFIRRILLPDLAMKARLRAWCGDCPDEPRRWCIVDTIDLRPDTLIVDLVNPAAGTAEILWRGQFDWNAVADGRWRLAQVMEGSV